jgi:hypothetical protein
MNATKIVGKRKAPQTPAEFHALAAALDRESEALRRGPRKSFIFKARTWDELERFEAERLLARSRASRRT